MSAENNPDLPPPPPAPTSPPAPLRRTPLSRLRPTVDTVTTINEDGSHRALFPADVRGRFTEARRISAFGLIAVYLLLPWIPVNGAPAVFLDVGNRRFHFLGFTLATQDTWLLFFGVTGLGFALFFITALFGRVWCGWACPQTVFLEHVFRRIERWIEGDAPARRAFRAAPVSAKKVFKLGAKHALFILASLAITHLFLAYFISLPELWHFMREAPGEHWDSFLFVFITAGVLYFNFAWFREQLCIIICPYGRLQSALSDDHTMTIGYDSLRGEPRGRLGAPDAGACVDCNRCVQVCPTGIDIRHGMQLECVGCAACIDACDEVMVKVDRPTGLIRYDSLAGLGGGKTRWLRPRTILYGVLLTVGIVVAAWAFSSVEPVNVQVFRMSGASYFVGPEEVRNQFMIRLINKRSTPVVFTVVAEGLPAGVQQTGFAAPVTLPPLGESVSPFVLRVPRVYYRGPFKFTVKASDESRSFTLLRAVEFIGPDAHLLEEEEHEKSLKH